MRGGGEGEGRGSEGKKGEMEELRSVEERGERGMMASKGEGEERGRGRGEFWWYCRHLLIMARGISW